ncbi:MAG: cytochrome c family protein [Alphaproteobacteria bacterium]|jgi:cytochrome c|nr:cytochrome c family protein [Alphaproteobacteria bacterium]
MGGEFYKVWGSILIALTVALAIGIGINEVTHSEHLDENAYKVDVPEGGAPTAAVAEKKVIEPITPLLASADLAAGEKAFKRCATCHTFEKDGPNKVGPNLYNVVGNQVGTISGFAYSDALKAMGGQWGFDELNAFLTKPKEMVPGTKMTFAGIKKPQDRANLIAFLRQHADSPLAIPGQ